MEIGEVDRTGSRRTKLGRMSPTVGAVTLPLMTSRLDRLGPLELDRLVPTAVHPSSVWLHELRHTQGTVLIKAR